MQGATELHVLHQVGALALVGGDDPNLVGLGPSLEQLRGDLLHVGSFSPAEAQGLSQGGSGQQGSLWSRVMGFESLPQWKDQFCSSSVVNSAPAPRSGGIWAKTSQRPQEDTDFTPSSSEWHNKQQGLLNSKWNFSNHHRSQHSPDPRAALSQSFKYRIF